MYFICKATEQRKNTSEIQHVKQVIKGFKHMLYTVGLYIMYEDQIPGYGTTWRQKSG